MDYFGLKTGNLTLSKQYFHHTLKPKFWSQPAALEPIGKNCTWIPGA